MQGNSNIRRAFWRGYRDCAPFLLIVIPYSMLFGVVARDAGLALLQDGAPVFIALLTALAVNLRMAMYSAALVPYVGHARLRTRALMAYLMVDQAFAVAVIPPFTNSVCPLTKLLACDDRNTAAPTSSSTLPQRPCGVRFCNHVVNSGSATSAAFNGVSKYPGAMALQFSP